MTLYDKDSSLGTEPEESYFLCKTRYDGYVIAAPTLEGPLYSYHFSPVTARILWCGCGSGLPWWAVVGKAALKDPRSFNERGSLSAA